MTFKVRDLMIDVSSAAAQFKCPGTSLIFCNHFCTYIVPSVCHLGCTYHAPSICAWGSITVTVTCPGTLVTDTTPILQTIPQVSGPALTNLKDQLKQALELAERQEVAQDEALK